MEDWTKNCKNVDVPAFIRKLENLKKGESYTCPLCLQGQVSLIYNDDAMQKYGCDHCDMNITLESRVND